MTSESKQRKLREQIARRAITLLYDSQNGHQSAEPQISGTVGKVMLSNGTLHSYVVTSNNKVYVDTEMVTILNKVNSKALRYANRHFKTYCLDHGVKLVKSNDVEEKICLVELSDLADYLDNAGCNESVNIDKTGVDTLRSSVDVINRKIVLN